jgi:surface carbohydrate biosynthesis protein
VRIGIVLDNPRRELDGILLVAHHLVRGGHRVFIVPMYQQGYDLPWLDADAIIVNYARPENLEFLAACKAVGTKVVVLDNEGGVVPQDDAQTPYGADAIRRGGLHPYIDRYLFWGERQYEHFRARSPLPPESLHVTGCPRYDFCHPRWRSAVGYERSDYVLINTNFSAINPLFTGSVARERDKFRAAGWDMQHTDAYLQELAHVFEAYVADLRTLALQNPELAFLVRPHPFEGTAVYERRFAGCANVSIDGRGSAISMIGNARCVVQLNCQTAVETLMMDKLSVSLEYLNTEGLRRRYALPSQISYPAASLEEVNEMVRRPEPYAAKLPMRELWQRHVEPLFHKNDGDAARRVAQVIAALPPARRRPGAARRLRQSLRGSYARASPGRLLQGLGANAAGSQAVSALRSWLNPRRKTKYASAAEVRRAMAAIAQADGSPLALDCRHARHPLLGVPLATLELQRAD